MKRILLVLLLLLFSLPLAGCDLGGKKEETTTVALPTPTPVQATSLSAYFLRDGKVQPVNRTVKPTPAVARASLQELLGGPTARERDSLGLASGLPAGAKVDDFSVADGIAKVKLTGQLDEGARAQIVYTLTQFPTVRQVQFGDGARLYRRSDFEAQTPAIFVESPLPLQQVESPLHVFGTSNTFEATFEYELLDPSGRKIVGDTVTGASGTGTRGTFELTRSFSADRHGLGKLVLFERSAADGSRINVVEIPVRL